MILSKSCAAILLAGLSPSLISCEKKESTASLNVIPRWRGINLLDVFSPNPQHNCQPCQEAYFQWMSDWGFDFVRLPMAYPHYIEFDKSRHILPEEVYNMDEKQVEKADNLVHLANKYGMHMSLDLHRAPGYCINSDYHELYNLWQDKEALDEFCYHWEFWAKRYKNLSSEKISFDLVNDLDWRDDMNDQHSKSGPVPGDVYRRVAKAAFETKRGVNPIHLV